MDYRTLIEEVSAETRPASAGYYRYPGGSSRYLYRGAWKGSRKPPERLSAALEVIGFLRESGSPVLALERERAPMEGLFTDEEAESALALPLFDKPDGTFGGVLFLWAPHPFAFSGTFIEKAERLTAMVRPPEDTR